MNWRRRVRGTLGLALLWAGGMAGVGGLIELLDNILPGGLPMASGVDMWPQTLALVGFLGGAIFAVVLGVAGRRRRFDQLSLPRFAAWGAVAGLLLGLRPLSLGAPAAFLVVTSLGSALAAAASLALARVADRRERLAGDREVDAVALSRDEVRQRLNDTHRPLD
jgi:hypothetical protein